MKKKAREKPFWERAYKGHAYWLGKKKLGKVTLLKDGYAWEAGGRQGVAEEIGVAGGVEQVDAGVFGLEARDRQLQGVLQLLFQGGVVTGSGAALDAAAGGNRSRLCEQRLGQAGLPRPGLADKRKRPYTLDRI